MNQILILLGKIISALSKITNLGSGSTWPGEIALITNPNILAHFFNKVKKGIIIIAGTNGKTTTAKMVQEMISSQYPIDTIVHNDSGANLLNGITSAFIKKAKIITNSYFDWAVLEVDENTLPILLKYHLSHKDTSDGVRIKTPPRWPARLPAGREGTPRMVEKPAKPKIVIALLNLFRDQLDRYGEVDTIVSKWLSALKNYLGKVNLITNADDPTIAYMGLSCQKNVTFFGIDKAKGIKEIEHATDSIFCPLCGHKLSYEAVYYSHIGRWACPSCNLNRPKIQTASIKTKLPGLYNFYNTQCAVLIAQTIGIKESNIKSALQNFTPAFGRQEEFSINGKKIKIFLSKNPVGFNESLKTVIDLGARQVLLVLNDRIPDGRDVSWIWDVDFEIIPENTQIIASGERCYDLALRLKYAGKKFEIEKDLRKSIQSDYILPTYSAMLEVRKILTGKKIL
ncbi:Mur ligase family protein [Candidatus Gottesmanbacteria bacterium]|nr:Mur ligase family protein [Candidatus Gottesmanbacteria bacterium]